MKKGSLITKITLLNIIPILIALLVTTLIGAISIANFGHESVEESLQLLCETGKNNVNYYLKSIEQSVNTVSKLIDQDLDTIADADFNTSFASHMEKSKIIFNQAAENTNGVFTYYYRVKIEVTNTTNEKGFWFVYDQNQQKFKEHEVTDLSDDQFECVWFYTPMNTGEPIWLPPYVTDNLDAYVLSYNAPVYRNGEFIGVVGIEIDYETLGEQIEDIKLLDSGYAFIIENDNGTIIYHPTIDLLGMEEKDRPLSPPEFIDAFKKGEKHIVYTFEGVHKHCYTMTLSNNMSIVVTVPIAEVNNVWLSIVTRVIIVALVFIVASTIMAIVFSRYITKPLKQLTLAAEDINNGNYKVKLDYKGHDEMGVLTNTFNKLIHNLDGYITDLNTLAYADTLTSVRNRSAFEIAMKELQKEIDEGIKKEFAIAIFDCDNLKAINDVYGHDKGNVYLRNSSNLICRVFQNTAVYRIGGDEFAIILVNEDFANRESLKEFFINKSAEISSFAKEPWEEIKVSVGIATYDSEIDSSAEDVMIHADHLMYEHKRSKKTKVK